MPKHDPPGDDAALLELERELMELDRAIRAAEENRDAIDYALFDRRDAAGSNPQPTSADKALEVGPRPGSTTMLAEIFLIRMEAILRASKESAPADSSWFVPITLADKGTFKRQLDDHDRESRRACAETVSLSRQRPRLGLNGRSNALARGR